MSLAIPANDPPHPTRPPELSATYTTRSGAEQAALRLALRASETRRAGRIPYLTAVVAPDEGGTGYEPVLLEGGEGWGVIEVSLVEQTRRQQTAMRAEVARLLESARENDRRADESPRPGAYRRMLREQAERARDEARKLEARLAVALVRGAA